MTQQRTVAIAANGNTAAQRIFTASTVSGNVAIELVAETWAAATTCTLQVSVDGVSWSGLVNGSAIIFEDANKLLVLPAGLYYRIVTALYVGSAGIVFRMKAL